jgi:transposase
MSNKAPTLREFQARFPTEEVCLDHLMRTRFGDRHACEGCGREAHFYRVKARRSYACEYCGHQVYPTAGTPFDRTRTPLRDWFFVMFLFCSSRNGVAAKEVERQLGVTYKTAWRMCHLIREYMGKIDGDEPIGGAGVFVEIDEVLIGGRRKGKGSGYNREGKTFVMGMVQRGGSVLTEIVLDAKRSTLWPIIQANVLPGTVINTDELASYRSITIKGYRHLTVNHKAGQYVGKGGASTNSIESFWAQLKRGINGTHIHVSSKHLPKYLGEFEYRHNMRHLPHLMLDRLMVSFQR